MEVEMKIRGLMMDPVTNMPIVVLKDTQGSAILPIWVGIYEANAIALEIEKVQTPRPMTHDLLKNVLLGLDVKVNKVVVSDLKEDTFYALIWMEKEGQLMSMDSRPSDALALALRLDCPIFVDDEVLRNSKVASAVSEKSTNEELRKWLEGLSDEDLGRYKMYPAIGHRYSPTLLQRDGMSFLLKFLNGCSLAAVHAGLTRRPAAARKVIGETLRAAYPPDMARMSPS